MTSNAFAAGLSNGTSVPVLLPPVANNPSATQQFCLKWNNHTTNLVKTFGEMIAGESFTDVTLACDGLMIKAHKIVLSACSNYFRELFLATPCKHPIVVLKDMKIEDLRAIIDFMYRGEVNVSQNQLGNLLKTAEVLRVKGLTEVNDTESMKSDTDASFHMNTTSVNSMDHSGIGGGKSSSSIGNNSLNTSASSILNPDLQNMQSMPSVLSQQVDGLVASASTASGSRRRKKRRNENGTRNGRSISGNHHQSATTTAILQHQAVLMGKDPDSADLEEDDMLGSHSDADSMAHSSESESLDVAKASKRMVQSETRESIIANSFTSIASTSASSASHSQISLPQIQGPITTAAGHMMDQGSHSAAVAGRSIRRVHSHTQSNQREIVSTDTSLADGVSNDGSESWSAQGNNSMALALRGPVDDDSESDPNDTRSFVNHGDGSDGGRSVDVNQAMNQALALSAEQMALQAQSPGGDASGTGRICVCHLCHLTFTAYSSLRRHMARHFTDRERYECDVCLKSYSRKDYLKEHKKLKHQIV